MKTFFMTLLGVVLGAAIGTAVGLGVGSLAVDVFDISCFEGACGYAVVFLYAPVGLLIGAVLGGVIFYKALWSSSKIGKWLYIVAGALLGWLAATIILEIAVRLLVWFLNLNLFSDSTADMIVAIYPVFNYIVLAIGIGWGGRTAYKLFLSYRQKVTPVEAGLDLQV